MLTHSEFILLEEESVVGYEAMMGCREVMGKVERDGTIAIHKCWSQKLDARERDK